MSPTLTIARPAVDGYAADTLEHVARYLAREDTPADDMPLVVDDAEFFHVSAIRVA